MILWHFCSAKPNAMCYSVSIFSQTNWKWTSEYCRATHSVATHVHQMLPSREGMEVDDSHKKFQLLRSNTLLFPHTISDARSLYSLTPFLSFSLAPLTILSLSLSLSLTLYFFSLLSHSHYLSLLSLTHIHARSYSLIMPSSILFEHSSFSFAK